MNIIMVYGSLLKGLHNHSLLQEDNRTQWLGTGLVEGYLMYPLCGGAFPCVVGSTNFIDTVQVEIYSVPDNTLDRLDTLEGYPDLYDKREVITTDGRKGWMYYQHAPPPTTSPVLGGDWKQYLKEG